MTADAHNSIPQALLNVMAHGSEQDARDVLALLFAPHALLDDPDQADGAWFDADHAGTVKRWYADNRIPKVIHEIAPTWDDAKQTAVDWLAVCPHTCRDYDDWHFRSEALPPKTAKAYLKALVERSRAAPPPPQE